MNYKYTIPFVHFDEIEVHADTMDEAIEEAIAILEDNYFGYVEINEDEIEIEGMIKQ